MAQPCRRHAASTAAGLPPILCCPPPHFVQSSCPLNPAAMPGWGQAAPAARRPVLHHRPLRHGPRLVVAACLLALASGAGGVQYINDELLWMKAHWQDYKLPFPWSAAVKQRDAESTRQLQVGAGLPTD